MGLLLGCGQPFSHFLPNLIKNIAASQVHHKDLCETASSLLSRFRNMPLIRHLERPTERILQFACLNADKRLI